MIQLICKKTYYVELSEDSYYSIEKGTIWKVVGESDFSFIIQHNSKRSDVFRVHKGLVEEIFDFI